jgi:hypothetical protein
MTRESQPSGRESSRAGYTEQGRGDGSSPRTTAAARALRRFGRAWLRAQVRVAGPPWDGGRPVAARGGAGREGIAG